ncbi:hypothetical protein B0J13DRAFT_42914 [Dactylonectria estremocensis]|uniref:Uncharacterized protein n=1 Tax=Dactylonectria estremocensis TaxID=1079267 RepID=A0A9P9EUV1_9HYPO|nr:hypothetical protein B0J13DRAFT_42914 [Dactylonectria estremocensis]
MHARGHHWPDRALLIPGLQSFLSSRTGVFLCPPFQDLAPVSPVAPFGLMPMGPWSPPSPSKHQHGRERGDSPAVRTDRKWVRGLVWVLRANQLYTILGKSKLGSPYLRMRCGRSPPPLLPFSFGNLPQPRLTPPSPLTSPHQSFLGVLSLLIFNHHRYSPHLISAFVVIFLYIIIGIPALPSAHSEEKEPARQGGNPATFRAPHARSRPLLTTDSLPSDHYRPTRRLDLSTVDFELVTLFVVVCWRHRIHVSLCGLSGIESAIDAPPFFFCSLDTRIPASLGPSQNKQTGLARIALPRLFLR